MHDNVCFSGKTPLIRVDSLLTPLTQFNVTNRFEKNCEWNNEHTYFTSCNAYRIISLNDNKEKTQKSHFIKYMQLL